MNRLKLQNYNLHQTLLGGQSFGWDYVCGYYYGFTQKRAIKMKWEDEYVFWQTYPEKDDSDFIESYLGLDRDFDNIKSTFRDDKHLKTAIEKFPNLRILRQDFEETLLSFLISPVNSIPSIRKRIRMMNKTFGDTVDADGVKIKLFPRTEVLADADLSKLLGCSLGFRARNIINAARSILEYDLASKVKSLSESEARSELKKIKGVGDKVADCVLLMALGFDNVFPLDRWGIRILTNLYDIDPKTNYDKMRQWFEDYHGEYAGWAGQFLFEWIRTKGNIYDS